MTIGSVRPTWWYPTKDMALKGADFMQFFRRSDVHFSLVSFHKRFWWEKTTKIWSWCFFLFGGSPNFEGVNFFVWMWYISTKRFPKTHFLCWTVREFLVDQLHKCFLCFFGGGLKPMVVLHPKWWFVKGGLLLTMAILNIHVSFSGAVILSSCFFLYFPPRPNLCGCSWKMGNFPQNNLAKT